MQSSFIFNPQEGVEGEDIKAWTQATLAFGACNFIFPSFPSSPSQLLQLSGCLPSGRRAGKLACKAVINLSPFTQLARELAETGEPAPCPPHQQLPQPPVWPPARGHPGGHGWVPPGALRTSPRRGVHLQGRMQGWLSTSAKTKITSSEKAFSVRPCGDSRRSCHILLAAVLSRCFASAAPRRCPPRPAFDLALGPPVLPGRRTTQASF